MDNFIDVEGYLIKSEDVLLELRSFININHIVRIEKIGKGENDSSKVIFHLTTGERIKASFITYQRLLNALQLPV